MENNNVKVDPSICPKCLGTGKVGGETCDECWGMNASPGALNIKNGNIKKNK